MSFKRLDGVFNTKKTSLEFMHSEKTKHLLI
jgi:hypothetical protein